MERVAAAATVGSISAATGKCEAHAQAAPYNSGSLAQPLLSTTSSLSESCRCVRRGRGVWSRILHPTALYLGGGGGGGINANLPQHGTDGTDLSRAMPLMDDGGGHYGGGFGSSIGTNSGPDFHTDFNGTSGLPNTGGGGGGTDPEGLVAGDGGSGVVVVKYKALTQRLEGGSVSTPSDCDSLDLMPF